jgi:uncharacterized protein (TIGR03437 family)
LLLLLAGFPVAYGQQYSISTIAGGAPPSTPAVAVATAVGYPSRVTLDSGGNLYFTSGNSVFKVVGPNLILLAGNSRAGFSGDGGPAVNAQLNAPAGLAIDPAGNIYVADTVNNRVRVINSSGIINTFAGNGSIGGGGLVGNGGLALNANLYLPAGVAVDSKGDVFIADTGNNEIREVTPNGIISVLAGDSLASYAGDTQLAILSEVNHPEDVIVDSLGNVYIADTGNALIRQINTVGIINTFAGSTAVVGYAGDGASALVAGLIEPYALALDSSTNVYIAERSDGRIREVTVKTGFISTVVGTGYLGFTGDGSAANKATLNLPTGVAVDASGNIYIADSLDGRVRKAASGGNSGTITTIAGNGGVSYSGDGGPAIQAQLNMPQAVTVDSSGNVYIADTANNVVRKVTAAGIISTLAGNGVAGFGGDGSAASSAQLNAPQGVAVDASGNVYIADTGNARVRKVSTSGTISTYAGSGTIGFSGNGGAAASAQLNTPIGLAVDSAGNLYIADFGNNMVRKVTSGGTISTVAGTGVQSYSGDGGLAISAALNGPQGVAVDAAGNLYISDSQNSRVRVVTPGGSIGTVAGAGLAGYTGDGGLATSAQIVHPSGIAVDSSGGIYITDTSAIVRKFFVGGPIFTIAGNSTQGYSGDGGSATSAQLNTPVGLAVDSNGNVYIADSANNAIRKLQLTGFASSIGAAVSAASNQVGTVAPGELLVLYGSSLGPAGAPVSSTFNSNGLLPTTLAGTTVYFNGSPGPILYTSANQVGTIVPFGTSPGNLAIYVIYQSQSTAPVTLSVAPAAPTLFTLNYSGAGQAAAINNTDSSVNGAAHPAAAGSYVSLYATGLGQTNPAGIDGLQAMPPLPQPVLAVTATIGGKPAVVQYAGGAQYVVAGVSQINLQVPSGLTAGPNPVVITVNGVSSPAGVTIVVD